MSSTCPWTRFDGVTFGQGVVHGNFSTFTELLVPNPAPTCTADAAPYSFFVAVEADRLPRRAFTLRLDERCRTVDCEGEELRVTTHF